jgi:hypothetical protein
MSANRDLEVRFRLRAQQAAPLCWIDQNRTDRNAGATQAGHAAARASNFYGQIDVNLLAYG